VSREQVYREAARQVTEGENGSACFAISKATYSFAPRHLDYWDKVRLQLSNVDYFAAYLKPEIVDEWGRWYDTFVEENQMARSLALLFMAEISKDEGN
jgi:hypothetical protein